MFNDIASILPNALKRSGLGPKLREAELLEHYERLLDHVLPGDLRSSVRAMAVSGGVLTVASLSAYATRELKRKEGEILRLLNREFEGRPVSKVRYLA